MRAICHRATPASGSAAQAFEAALGVVQSTKSLTILAVHNDARKLVAFESSKMSNPKIYVIGVDDQGSEPMVGIAVGTDPRTRKALLDGKFNEKSANRFVEAVQGALNGTAPAPCTPVANHYLQKKTQVPWTDPSQEPDIDLGFSWLGLVAHMR